MKTREIVDDYLRLRHQFISYLYTEAYRYYTDGVMIFRPLYYLYPKLNIPINKDKTSFNQMNQNNAQFKKFYDQIIEEEEKARETIENALNEK